MNKAEISRIINRISYLHLTAQTDAAGEAVFRVPQRPYRIRADYLGQQYWSADTTWEAATIGIDHGIATVEVTRTGIPVDNVKVYVFTSEGTYLNMNGTTDAQGLVAFALPAGAYRFRADYQGGQYWGEALDLVAHQDNPVHISTGGGSVVLTVGQDDEIPLVGVRAYVFSEAGTYLGEYANTDNNGQAGFALADGTYKVRVDYLGYQYWTEPFTVPDDTDITMTIEHRLVRVNALTEYSGNRSPLEGVPVYLFTPSDSYQNITVTTDSNGQAFFTLPYQAYKLRLDYLGQQYMGEPFTSNEVTAIIDEGRARIHLGNAAEAVPVYVFSEAGSYLGITGLTGADGTVQFQLPAGFYRFRADYQGDQLWASHEVLAHTVTDIPLHTGGDTLAVTVRAGEATVLAGVTCALFDASGTSLDQQAVTDANGMVSFTVADGAYQVRVEYLGAQYWSDHIEVPATTTATVMIEHEEVTVTVLEEGFESEEGIPGVACALFTESGIDTGIRATTDENGEAHLLVPNQRYRVRADYQGSPYWSALFSWEDVSLVIPHGELVLYVLTDDELAVPDVPVSLFTATGSSVGLSARTDETGRASFSVPEGSYQARVDVDGEQYWSEVLNILPYEQQSYEFFLSEDALTNNPSPLRHDGEAPIYQPLLAFNGLSLTGMLSPPANRQLTDTARVYWYISDHLGTAQLVTNHTGAVVWLGEEKPFGEVTTITGDLDHRFRFPGQYYDNETGLHYNWNRYYDPETGRYLSPDPIGLAGGMNLYAYVQNDPVNWVDPWGLTADCPATVDGARLRRTQFIRYPNRDGEETFHCGYECYIENRSEGYCPDNPGAECCYDEKGLLVDENHKYAKCGGSNDDYFCNGMTKTPIDCLKHAGPGDRGGIWNRGKESYEETRRHYCDTHPGTCKN